MGSSIDINEADEVPFNFFVTRSGGNLGAASVVYTTVQGTATGGGVDFATSSGTLSWLAGERGSRNASIWIRVRSVFFDPFLVFRRFRKESPLWFQITLQITGDFFSIL